MVYAALHMLQNFVITLYDSYIYVYHVPHCLKAWYVLIEYLDTMPFIMFHVYTWFMWQ